MNIQSIINEVQTKYCKRVYGTRQELDTLMVQLDKHTDIVAFGLIENSSGLFVEIIKLEEE